MKNTPRRKRIFSILVFLMVISTACGITYAIYTSQVYQRAVIRNRDTEAIRFSSDKLFRVNSDNATPKIYYYPVNSGQKTMSFSVCNYDQGKNTVVNQHTIEYDISFTFADGTDGFEYKVNNSPAANLTGSLAGNKHSTNTYQIEFSENDYNNLRVTVEVIPRDNTLTKNTKLYAILVPIEFATTQGVSFEWGFDKSYSFNEVDAFNVSMSVSGGEDLVTIIWDNTMLDIDPFFKEKMIANGSDYTENGNDSRLSFTMNSEDESSDYHFQFYQHGKRPSEWTGWDKLPVSITSQKSQNSS